MSTEGFVWEFARPLSKRDAVDEFCASHGITLPAALSACLQANNGACPTPDGFATGRRAYTFKSLLSFAEGDLEDVRGFYPLDPPHERLFPFALEAGGDLVCYDPDGERLVLWRHETDEAEPVDYASNPELFASLGFGARGD